MADKTVLGQMVVQITMDRSAYDAAAAGLQSSGKQVGASVSAGAEAGAKGLDSLGASAHGAQRELAVMIHELATGNIKNFEGSILVLGERLNVLEALMSPIGAAVTALGVGIVAFGVAAAQGAAQADAFNKAMQATAGYAGVSADQFNAIAAQMASAGVPATKAADALTDVISTGKVAGAAVQSVATASALLSQATGTDAKQIVDQFADMSENVAAGAAKMSDQYHFLTTAQYDEIKALQEHGDTAGATKIAADALTESLKNQAQQLGTLPSLFRSFKSAMSSLYQGAMNLGKPETPADHLASLQQQLAEQQDIVANGGWQTTNGQPVNLGTDTAQKNIADLQNEIREWQKMADATTQAAQQQGVFKVQEQQALDAAQAVDKLSQSFDKNYAKEKALVDLQSEYQRLWNDPSDPTHSNSRLRGVTQNANGTFSGGQYSALVSGIDDRYKDHGAAATDRAQLSQQVDAVRQALNQINDAYRNSESVLDAAHNAGATSDASYYEQQRDLIAKTANDQASQLEREIGILQQHKASGAEQVQINKQIQDAEQQLQKVRDDTAAKFQKNVEQEQAAAQKRKATLDEFVGALNQQLSTQQNGVDIQVAAVGMGSQEASQAQQLNSLQHSYDSQRTRIASSMAKVNPDSDTYALYQSELAALQDANDKAVSITKDGFARMKAAQGDWTNGAIQGWQNFQDQAANVAGEMSQTFSDAFSGLTSALTTFVTTGRLSFSSFAQSVEKDLAQIVVRSAESQIFGPIMSALGLGGASSTTGYSFTAPTSIQGSGALFGASAGYASGGSVWGSGTGTSDSINARLSNGEFVVRDAVASQPGMRSLLTALNGGTTASGGNRFASGGSVLGSNSGSTVQPNVNVIVQNAPQGTQVQRSTGAGGIPSVKVILPALEQALAGRVLQGGSPLPSAMERRYGLNRGQGSS